MSDEATTTPVLPKAQSRWRGNLRIGVSAFFGLLTVALCVLWVRSYWWLDIIGVRLVGARAIAAASQPGTMELSVNYPSNSAQPPPIVGTSHFMLASIPQESPNHMLWAIGRHVTPTGTTVYIYVPHYFLAFVLAIIAAAPWLRSRFSLRTLLIATTLVALVLGLGVWLAAVAVLLLGKTSSFVSDSNMNCRTSGS